MANTNLTIDMILRESLEVLHEKLVYVGSIHRDYDDSYANEGAKIGDSLRIRKPDEYVVSSGATLVNQDATETSVTLTIDNQKHVGLRFGAKELALDIDDFRERKIEPSMSVLAAAVESDALNMRKDVWNIVDNDGSALTFKNVTDARAEMNKNLAPKDNNRYALLSDNHSSTIVDALKGLFNDPRQVSQQYREGMMGRSAGFNFQESSHAGDHTTGTAEETTTYLVDGTAESGSAITVDTGATTFLIGDVITFAGVYRVHPETKISTGELHKFVITADSGASATSLAISPSLTATGGSQNVTNVPADDAAVVKVGAGANELLSGSLCYHRDAFALGTADLELPQGVHFAAREVFDGISLRIVKQYDINEDRFPCRTDVLYGYKALRPQLACRIHADG